VAGGWKGREGSNPGVKLTCSASGQIEVCRQGLGRSQEILHAGYYPAATVLFYLQLPVVRSAPRRTEGGKLDRRSTGPKPFAPRRNRGLQTAFGRFSTLGYASHNSSPCIKVGRWRELLLVHKTPVSTVSRGRSTHF
jgi:hypothetical protein